MQYQQSDITTQVEKISLSH